MTDSQITISIMPAVDNMPNPLKFSMEHSHNSESVTEYLCDRFGGGVLEDSEGYLVPPDPEQDLKAGQYFFRLSEPAGLRTKVEFTIDRILFMTRKNRDMLRKILKLLEKDRTTTASGED